jgi:hypothetical protein
MRALRGGWRVRNRRHEQTGAGNGQQKTPHVPHKVMFANGLPRAQIQLATLMLTRWVARGREWSCVVRHWSPS